MKTLHLFGTILILTSGGLLQGAPLFSGPSSFTLAPTTQLGSLVNNLVLTDTANGFVVSGQLLITVPASFVSGTLAAWEVDRPLDPAFGSATLQTTTILTGFSTPPPGAVGNTSGAVTSYFTDNPNPPLAGSASLIPMTLVLGVDIPAWNNLTMTSSSFAYVSGGVNFLHQRFDLDGIYFGGPGGVWTVDVPLASLIQPVPEASGLWLGVLMPAALLGLVWRRKVQ